MPLRNSSSRDDACDSVLLRYSEYHSGCELFRNEAGPASARPESPLGISDARRVGVSSWKMRLESWYFDKADDGGGTAENSALGESGGSDESEPFLGEC